MNSSPKIANFLLLVFSFSCAQPPPIPSSVSELGSSREPNYIITSLGDTIPLEVPTPIKGREIPRDSVEPPVTRPLGEPERIPARLAIHPALPSKKIELPDELPLVVPGTNGAAAPDTTTIQFTGRPMPGTHPEWEAAMPMKMSDKAKFDIRYLDVKSGIQSAALMTMIADSRGYLWLGNLSGGLSQFDGRHFKHFDNSAGVSHQGITSLYEDKNGHIWMGTILGTVYYYDGHRFFQYNQEEGIPFESLSVFEEDDSGSYWFLKRDGGLYQFIPDPESGPEGRPEEWRGKLIHFKQVNANERSGLLVSRFGHIWIESDLKLIRYIPPGTGLPTGSTGFTPFELSSDSGPLGVVSITEDPKGNIWMGTNRAGLIRYEPDEKGIGGQWTHFPVAELATKSGIPELMAASDGAIWFRTYQYGLFRFDPPENDQDLGEYMHFTTEQGLTSNDILKIVEDAQGKIWVATADAGICRIDVNSFHNFGAEAGLTSTGVQSILEDRRGQLWFGTGIWNTNGIGLFGYDGQNFYKYTMGEGLPSNSIRSMMEDKQGVLWLSTNNGLGRFDGQDVSHYNAAQGLGRRFTWYSLEDRWGNIWIASGGMGLIRFQPDAVGNGGDFTHFNEQEGINRLNFHVLEDRCHQLWVSGRESIVRLSSLPNDTQVITHFQNHVAIEAHVYSTAMTDHKGRIWFGTNSNGLSIYQSTNCDSIGSFTNITTEAGLPDNRVWSIIEDRENRVWVGTGKGLAVLVPLEENSSGAVSSNLPGYQTYTFDTWDGLPEISFTRSSAFLDSKNRLWLGRNLGVSMLDLNNFKLPSEAPQNAGLAQIDIQQQYIDYRRLRDSSYRNQFAFGEELMAAFDSIPSFQNYPSSLNLPYYLNDLSFHCLAQDWAGPHKIKYSYYLEGLEKDWRVDQAAPKVVYNNLPPGNYALKLRAIGVAQRWSDTFEYPFTIRPPWWQSWWARILYALAAIAAIFGLIQWRTYTLRKRQKELERTVRERTAEVVAEKERSEELLLNILPSETAEELKQNGYAQAKSYDTVTVLFTDFKSFTMHSRRLSAQELVKEIDHCFKAFDLIMEEYNVEKIKTVGDAYMAAAGLPVPNSSNPVDAVKAALAIRDFMLQYKKERTAEGREAFEIRIGVHTGPVVAGIVGIKKFSYDIWGDTVNMAARMESSGEVGKVNISQSTFEYLKDNPEFSFMTRGKINVKNLGEVEMYFAEGIDIHRQP